MDDVGDYYERKRKEQHEAWLKWMEAMAFHTANPTAENLQALQKAHEKFIDAGNTGD